MNIPNQIPLLDIVVNYLFGLLCVLSGILYVWNFTAFDVLDFAVKLQWIGILLFILLPYLIGFLFSGVLFPFLLRLSVFSPKSPLNKFQMFVGATFLGIKQKPDGRVTFLSDSDLDNIIKKKVKKIFSLDVDKLNDTTKMELFYIIMRYIDNYSQGNTTRLERSYLLTNALSGTTLFLLLTLIINTIALFISFKYALGYIPLPLLITIEIIAIIMIRYLASRFQSNLLFWWKNVWRSFVIIEHELSTKRK